MSDPEQMRALANTPHAAIIDMRAALRTAADEVDRLRALIKDAPHAEGCVPLRPGIWRLPCICWKADAL